MQVKTLQDMGIGKNFLKTALIATEISWQLDNWVTFNLNCKKKLLCSKIDSLQNGINLNNSIYPECRPKIPQNLKHTFPVGEWIHESNRQFWKFSKQKTQTNNEYLDVLSRTLPNQEYWLNLPSDFIPIQSEQSQKNKYYIFSLTLRT